MLILKSLSGLGSIFGKGSTTPSQSSDINQSNDEWRDMLVDLLKDMD